MKISIFGTGYVGLVTGTCLAEVGHEVLCIDVDAEKIENLKKGIIPIYEPGLDELVERNRKSGRLNFSTSAEEGVKFGKIIFSAVGTPPDEKNQDKADLRYVYAVAETFGKYLGEYKVFVNKSTVPVGTGRDCEQIIKKEIYTREKNIEFDVVSNPEFLKEGSAIKDFLTPERIVIGTNSERSRSLMHEVYKPLIRGDVKTLFTDRSSAEIIKYAANSFLATKISFINEIANFCEKAGGNIADISHGIGLDSRIGKHFLSAGVGYGGSCLPKDVKAFLESAKEVGADLHIISSAEKANNAQKEKSFLQLMGAFHDDLSAKKICIWGASFKPNTDDIRESSCHNVIHKLIHHGVKDIRCYDPISLGHMKREYADISEISFYDNAYEALSGADALMLLTDWDEFRAPNFKLMKKSMNDSVIIDGRNIWSSDIEKDFGFQYFYIGKPC